MVSIGEAQRKRCYEYTETLDDAQIVWDKLVVVAVVFAMRRKWSEVLRCQAMWHGCADMVCIGGA
jgi:hypothetical protein